MGNQDKGEMGTIPALIIVVAAFFLMGVAVFLSMEPSHPIGSENTTLESDLDPGRSTYCDQGKAEIEI